MGENKVQSNFKIEPNLLEHYKSYCKEKHIIQAELTEKAMKEAIRSKVVQRKEFDIKIPVLKNYETMVADQLNKLAENHLEIPDIQKNRLKKVSKDMQKEILGYVNFNNYLDVWNDESYCYKNQITEHKGISILETFTAKYPVTIKISFPSDIKYTFFKLAVQHHSTDVLTSIISFDEAIEEIEISKNMEIYKKFPDFEKYKENPENYSNIKNNAISKDRSDILAYQSLIVELEKENSKYKKALNDCIKLVKQR